MSNRDRLYEAGILNPQQTLSGEQIEAIESLTTEEVDQLIAVNEKLAEDIESDDTLIEMPGRIAASQGE